MKSLLILGLGIAVGFALGWYFSRGPHRYYYETRRDLQLTGDQAQVLGSLPSGTPLVTDVALSPSPDLGWWAYAPIYFSTMAEAVEMGVEPRETGIESEIMESTLRAHLPLEVLYPSTDAEKESSSAAQSEAQASEKPELSE